MTEPEVLEKLAAYKDAIVKLKSQRDEYKQKYEELTSVGEQKEEFMSELKANLDEIDKILESQFFQELINVKQVAEKRSGTASIPDRKYLQPSFLFVCF